MGKKKKVLVTGACGFIGSHLVDKLVLLGYDVVATDLAEPYPYFINKNHFREFLNPKAVFIPANLSQEKDAMKLFEAEETKGVEIVFHAAAIFNFFKDYKVMYLNNILGTKNVCKSFTKTGFNPKKRLILFSSGVAGNEALKKGNYGKSKWRQEEFLRDFLFFHKGAFDAVIVRPAAVFGPRSRYGLAKIVKMIAGGQLQFFIGKKNLKASIIHVIDVVDAVIHLAGVPFEKLKEITEMSIPLFDLVDDSSYSYEELIKFATKILKESHGSRVIPIHLPVWTMKIVAGWQEFLAKKTGRQPKVAVDSLDFFRTPMVMDNSPAKKSGVCFKFNTLVAMKYTIDWYKERGWI